MVSKGHNYGLCRKCDKIHVHPFKGKPRSKKWCDNISKGKKGMKHTERSKKNISAGLVRAYAEGRMKSWNKGHTVETHPGVAKISESNKGNIPWNKGKTGVYSEETLRIMSEVRVQFYIDHPEAKLFGKDNPASRPEVRAKISKAHAGKTLSEEHKKAIGDAQRGIPLPEEMCLRRCGPGNPFYGRRHTKESKGQMSDSIRETFRMFPEKHSNRKMGIRGFVSEPQKLLFILVRQVFPDAELEYPIRTAARVRFADVGVPSMKLDFEYDGSHWHQDIGADESRDQELIEVGWKTIRLGPGVNEQEWIDLVGSFRRD